KLLRQRKTDFGSASGKGAAEKGEHAVAGDVGERSEFERVVAAVKAECMGRGAIAAEGVEHLAGEFREHGRVVFAVDHQAIAVGAHATLYVRHGTDGRPVMAKFVHGDVVAKAFPDVIGGHALAYDVGIIRGNVKEAADADGGVVHQRDVADGGADAGTENAEFRVALSHEAAVEGGRVQNSVTVGGGFEAKVGAANVAGAVVAARAAASVARQAQPSVRLFWTRDPFAE